VQRIMFWCVMLCGAAGHTYGANGIWQLNRAERPYGPSPHGMSWGEMPWLDACRLAGSRQVGLGRRLLERYEWWRLEPDADAVEPRWSHENYYGPYAATIPGQCRIIYIPRTWGSVATPLESGKHRAYFYDPITGGEYEIGPAEADTDGLWRSPPRVPVFRDLVLVVERADR